MQVLCVSVICAVVQLHCQFIFVKKIKTAKTGDVLFWNHLMFALGAGIGGNLSIRYGIRMIWVSCGFLMISFLLMFIEKYKHFHEEHEIK